MIYKFITDEDINNQIKQDLVADIFPLSERQKKIRKAESAVLKQIRSKAGRWYDIDSVLIKIPQWNDKTTYQQGSYVYYEGCIYKALTENTNTTPTDNEPWKDDDPRHELLVMYACDMIIYHLHCLVNPRKIPEMRRERYKEAVSWLELIAEKNESADFPENELDEQLIIWGSNPRIETFF